MLLRLVRTDTDDQGTFGEIYDEDRDFLCFTVEPPWRDNKQLISCILPGSYPLEPWNSRKYPGTLHVLATPGRSAILMHWGNWAGDESKGWKTNSNGCILLGKARGRIGEQQAILTSRPTVRRVAALEPEQLTIVEAY